MTKRAREILALGSADGLLVLVALSLLGRFCIQALKAVIAGESFCDYANLYLYSRLLAQGTAVYNLSIESLLNAQAGMPVHVCGPANSSPMLYFFGRLFDAPDYFHSLERWLIFSVFMVSLSIPLVIYGLGLQSDVRAVASALILLFLFPYLFEAFVLGQTSMLVHSTLAAYFYFLQKKRAWLAAIVATAVVAIRINFIPVLIIPVALRYWKTAFASIACCVGSFLVAVLALGSNTVLFFFRNALSLGFRPQVSFDPMNPSLQHTIQALFPSLASPLTNGLVLGIAGLVVLITAARLYRSAVPDTSVVFSTILAGTLAITPFLEIHYLLFLFIPVLTTMWRIGDSLTFAERVLFGFAFVVLAVPFGTSSFPAFHRGVLVLLANSKLLALFVLWGLLVRHLDECLAPVRAATR